VQLVIFACLVVPAVLTRLLWKTAVYWLPGAGLIALGVAVSLLGSHLDHLGAAFHHIDDAGVAASYLVEGLLCLNLAKRAHARRAQRLGGST